MREYRIDCPLLLQHPARPLFEGGDVYSADYLGIAKILCKFKENIDKHKLINSLCEEFSRNDPKFISMIFMDACYDDPQETR